MEPTWTLKDGTRVRLARGSDISPAVPRWYITYDAERPKDVSDFPRSRCDMWKETGGARPAYWCLVEVNQDGSEHGIPAAEVAAMAPKSILTTDKVKRKEMPIARGVVDYFPRALAAVANVSFVANQQHNPGEPMHWDKSKSTDHADCIARHLIERGAIDDDGLRHSAKLAWRALALLETELEAAGQ